MIINVTRQMFIDSFKNIRPSNFSLAGLNALFDHLEELEEDTGPMELDVIAICGLYSEYQNINEYNRENSTDHAGRDDIEETIVLPVGKESFIIRNY